jgi:Zn-dependent protease with chaperone function
MKRHRSGKLRGFVLARGLAFALLISFVLSAPLAGQRIHQEENGRIVPELDGVSMTPEQQIALGERAGARIRTQLPVLPDSNPVSLLVQTIGRRLAEKAPGYAWPYRFHVVALKEVNAFALPGGQIFVNLGTIQTTDESELAGIMAHEIAHVVLQHSAREAGKRKAARTAGVLGTIAAVATLGPVGGVLAAEALQMGAGAIVLKYSRADESEADLLGAQIMYDAGYDPFTFPEFFQRMAAQPEGSVTFLSNHPDPGSRGESVSTVIEKFPPKFYPRVESEEFRAAKRVADSMRTFTGEEIARHTGTWKFGAEPDPALSATLDNLSYEQVRVYGNWSHHEQPGLSFDYPGNWTVTAAGGETLVAPPAAISPSGAMAYGVTIRSTSAVKILNAPDHLTVSGREAIAYELSGDGPMHLRAKPLRERIWLVTAQHADGTLVTLRFVAPERDYDAIKGAFRTILKNLRLD